MKKIKYLMPCISLPLIASPAIALTGCSCKFNGKVSEAEFKSAIDTIWNTTNRGKFQINCEMKADVEVSTNIIVDGDSALIKYNNEIIGGEYYDSEAECKWLIASKDDPANTDIQLLAKDVGNKTYSNIHNLTGLDTLYEYRNKFSELTFENKSYKINEEHEGGLSITTTITFNKDKKIEKITNKAELKGNKTGNIEMVYSFSYDNKSISQEELNKLKPDNIHKGTVSGQTITFEQHNLYPTVEENHIPNFYVLPKIQYSSAWTATATYPTDLNFAKANCNVLVDCHLYEEASTESYNIIANCQNQNDQTLNFKTYGEITIPETKLNSVLSIEVKSDTTDPIDVNGLTFTIGTSI